MVHDDLRAHEVSITAKMTFTVGQRQAVDPEASLRAELLGQLVAAQFDIETAMREIAGNAAALSDGQAQLRLLTALQRQIGTASPAALAGLRGEIVATVSAAQAVAQQSRASANASERAAELANVTGNTRRTIHNVADELFEQRKLDPYLQFQSAEDEAAYRRREAEREAYIRAELAKGTPQGALNAANATISQLDDARAHGADRSPDFDRLFNAATSAHDAQRAAMATSPALQAASTKPEQIARATPETDAPADLDEIAGALRMAGVAVTGPRPLNSHGLANAKAAADNPLAIAKIPHQRPISPMGGYLLGDNVAVGLAVAQAVLHRSAFTVEVDEGGADCTANPRSRSNDCDSPLQHYPP